MDTPTSGSVLSGQRVLIEGIGGVGGVLAAKMIRDGHSPTLVTGNSEITEAINRSGLDLTTSDNEFIVPARAFTSLSELPTGAKFDAAYLLMKANGVVAPVNETVVRLVKEIEQGRRSIDPRNLEEIPQS